MCDRSLPLHRRFSRIHSQQLRRAAFGVHTPLRELRVPPSWFLTTSMVFSARKLQVCCALQPVMGFARVSRTVARYRACARWYRRSVSRRCFHPSKFSLSSSRTLSPGPVPPCRWCSDALCSLFTPFPARSKSTRSQTTSTPRSCSTLECVAPATVSSGRTPYPSVGFGPLRGFSLFRRSIESLKERFLAKANPGSVSTEVQVRLGDHTLPTCGGGGLTRRLHPRGCCLDHFRSLGAELG